MSVVIKLQRGYYASRAFALLAAIFLVIFGTAVVLLALDQQRVIDANNRLQEQTVPEIIRYQRLARNLEQLRQEGERIFAVNSHASRQQSMFVVTLIASHPSILEHPSAAKLTRETEQFLSEVVRQSVRDDNRPADFYDEWQRLAARLGTQVDDVSIQGVDLVTSDLNVATEAMRLARYKLIAVLVLFGLFLLAFVVLVRRHLIRPLQAIDRALSSLSVVQPAPEFLPTAMREIQAVEEAIREQHALLIQNDQARHVLEQLAINPPLPPWRARAMVMAFRRLHGLGVPPNSSG